MKLRLLLLLAATSVLLGSVGRAEPARRPRYGGTLRVEIGAVVNSIDPSVAAASPEETVAKDEICALLYERRNADGTFAGVAGSGAFRIAQWEPGKHLTLEANPDHRGGRAFVDSVEIEMGKPAHERLVDLEVGKTDFAEIPPEEVRRANEGGVRVSTSQPDELLAIVFTAGRPVAEDAHAREALSRSIDRSAIVNFILQKEGEPAGGLLPQWSSGTAFLFPTAADAAAAKSLWGQITGSPKIVLGYDASDPLEQSVAERIVVNARDAGIEIAAETGQGATASYDARLVRLRMKSPHPGTALASFLSALAPDVNVNGPTEPPLPPPGVPKGMTEIEWLATSAPAEKVYDAERWVVNSYRVVPLIWLPRAYGLSARVRDWIAPAPGEAWPFADVWLGDEQ